MIEQVDNYIQVKAMLERSKLDYSKVPIMSLSKWIMNNFMCKPKLASDYVEVAQEPRLIEVDEALRNYANCVWSKNKLLDNITSDEFVKYSTLIDKCAVYRNSYNHNERNMQVMWITGSSGSGKTTLAKYFAKKLNMEAYVTANGDNLFDSYDLQPIIIVDEFRASTMKFKEFLQLTDNHTNKQQGARYHNVDLAKCKLMIITSIVTPIQVYSMFRNDDGSMNSEPVEQLSRRLQHKYYCIEDGVCYEKEILQEKNGKISTRDTESTLNMDEVFMELGIDLSKKDQHNLVADLFKKKPKQASFFEMSDKDLPF